MVWKCLVCVCVEVVLVWAVILNGVKHYFFKYWFVGEEHVTQTTDSLAEVHEFYQPVGK